MPDDMKYAFYDGGTKSFWASAQKPECSNIQWSLDAKENFWLVFPLEVDEELPWNESLLERPAPPVRIKVGDFIKVWDNEEEPDDKDAEYGYSSQDEDESGIYTYHIPAGPYVHARLMNPPTRKE
jgi:hypothetical protein